MFNFTNILIICIFLLSVYFVYQLLIDNMRLIKKVEETLMNKIEDINDKIEETHEIINKNSVVLNNKIKECYDLELKMNELNILNNQKIISKEEFINENDNNEKSPLTENFFIKNKNDKELYYMSPNIPTSKNSNIISDIDNILSSKNDNKDKLSTTSSILSLKDSNKLNKNISSKSSLNKNSKKKSNKNSIKLDNSSSSIKLDNSSNSDNSKKSDNSDLMMENIKQMEIR